MTDKFHDRPATNQDSNQSRRSFLKQAANLAVAGITYPLWSKGAQGQDGVGPTGKVLIAYFSRTGNTREIAHQIQQVVGGDLFELHTVHSYPQAYRATTQQAREELDRNFRPQLTDRIQEMERYDVVFIGYPNWWGTMPMACFSFLEQYDFGGKTVIPFCTHEGSQLGRSVSDLRALCPQSQVREGLAIRGGDLANVTSAATKRQVSRWLTTQEPAR